MHRIIATIGCQFALLGYPGDIFGLHIDTEMMLVTSTTLILIAYVMADWKTIGGGLGLLFRD